MRELLSNNSLLVGKLYEDKSLALLARDLIFFTTDLQTVNYYRLQQFTARADLFLKQREWLITVNLHTVIVKEIHKSKQFN